MNKCSREIPPVPRNRNTVKTRLLRIAEKARREPELKFTSLFHLMNEGLLREFFKWLSKEAALGIDGMDVSSLRENLKEEWIHIKSGLLSGTYKPMPVREVKIPKPNGGIRTLGIPTVQDRMIQQAVSQKLTAIFDKDFSEYSYGFRPNRSAHDAVLKVREYIEQGYKWVVDIDIEKFFDRVNHDMLMARVARKVKDRRVLKLVRAYLNAGTMINGVVIEKGKGTPQGAPLSTLLSNILLDDLVVCFKQKADALRFKEALICRLAKFELEIVPSKTKVLAFGQYAEENAARKGMKPETFDFLGFTYYCSKKRDGKRFMMKSKTLKKKFTTKLKSFKMWLKSSRTPPTKILIGKVRIKLQGHYAYYGVTDNSDGISCYAYEVRKILHKWLNRRGKRKCLNWDKFCLLLKRYPLPEPKTVVCLF